MKKLVLMLVIPALFSITSCSAAEQQKQTETTFQVNWDEVMKEVDGDEIVLKTDKEIDVEAVWKAVSEFDSCEIDIEER